MINNISQTLLQQFLENIDIDKDFFNFINLIKHKYKAKIYIVSDGFKLFIKSILKDNLKYIDGVYANSLYMINNQFKIIYGYQKNDCQNGVCKCMLFDKLKNGFNIYIGDGKSDFCVSTKADFIFAKGKLANYLKDKNMHNFTRFSCFKDIINQLPFVMENLYERKPIVRN